MKTLWMYLFLLIFLGLLNQGVIFFNEEFIICLCLVLLFTLVHQVLSGFLNRQALNYAQNVYRTFMHLLLINISLIKKLINVLNGLSVESDLNQLLLDYQLISLQKSLKELYLKAQLESFSQLRNFLIRNFAQMLQTKHSLLTFMDYQDTKNLNVLTKFGRILNRQATVALSKRSR